MAVAVSLRQNLFAELRMATGRAAARSSAAPAEPRTPPSMDCSICLHSSGTFETLSEQAPARCGCGDVICASCVPHFAESSTREGRVPACGNCRQPYPLKALARFLDTRQKEAYVLAMSNMQTHVEAQYRASCPGCARKVSIQEAARSGCMRFACTHCGMNMCAVCQRGYPRSTIADDLVHEGCAARFDDIVAFQRLLMLLESWTVRACPTCGKGAGVKNDSCSHMSPQAGLCAAACTRWCFICCMTEAKIQSARPSENINHHSVYNRDWLADPTLCPMYLHHLAHVDERVHRAPGSCDNAYCRPDGECIIDPQCRDRRDWAAQSLLATMRIRYQLLKHIAAVTLPVFVRLLDAFHFRDTIDRNYFDGRFPWACEVLPHWLDFEPEQVRAFYSAREHWLVVPNTPAPASSRPVPAPPPPPPPGHRLHAVRM